MRRLLFSLLAITLMGFGVGCRATHGVCDCGCDFEDQCSYRAPWTSEGAPAGDTPMPVPEIREQLPNAPQKKL